MPTLVGSRVIAILGADPDTMVLRMLGEGVYVGNESPTSAAGWLAEAAVQHGLSNPKIVLDNGDTVWGCECWWGDVEGGRRTIEDYRSRGWTITEVRIEDARNEYRKAQGQTTGVPA